MININKLKDLSPSPLVANIFTLVDLLRQRAENQPDQVGYTFLIDGENEKETLTYRELDQKARATAAYLQKYCAPGERVLLLYPPGLDYIVAFFGCLYAGVVAVPAYPPRPNRSLLRLRAIIADAQAHTALTTTSILSNLERQFSQAPELENLAWITSEKLFNFPASAWQIPDINSQTLTFLQYTSGSTGNPKGVMISHENLLHNLHAIYQYFGHTAESRGVIWLPPYHDMGLIGGALQPLYGGFPVVLMSPLMFLQSPVRWLEAISRYRATTSGAPNFAYDFCLRKIIPEQMVNLDLSSWQVAFNGAEPINYQTLEQFAQKFAGCGFNPNAFSPCYGMAESTLMISSQDRRMPVVTKMVEGSALAQNQVIPATSAQTSVKKLVSVGHFIPDETLVIVNPETRRECQEGIVGEIWVSSPSVACGYWNQPEATEEAFAAYLFNQVDGEKTPFLRTGDLGFVSEGHLFVTGRLKEMIIINGLNYYPQDIEWTIEQNHSQLRPHCCAAFSVEKSGKEQLVVVMEVERKSWLSLRKTANSPGENEEGRKLLTSIRRTVIKNFDLDVYEICLLKPGSLPKTSSGKIKRFVCRQEFLEQTLTAVPLPTSLPN